MLAELIPERLRKIPELMAVIGAEDPEAQAAYDAAVDFLAQLNVDTATWGLALWEFEYGIQTDLTKPLDARRTALKAKMRGAATTTREEVKRQVELILQCHCTVVEWPDQYSVQILIYADTGTLDKLEECGKVVRSILPAHLAFEMQLLYPEETSQYCGFAVHMGWHLTID